MFTTFHPELDIIWIKIYCFSDNDVLNQMQSYQAAPVPEKLIEQPVPSQST